MTEHIHIDFPHKQAAHCESGVAANLLSNQGIALSEATAFGIGGGLFFAYLPFIRLNHLPMVTYRGAAGSLLKHISKIPGFTLACQTFSKPEQAMEALDKKLADSIPVGLQTGVFWLPYFPKALRFHFNAHNLVVYGKQGNDYLISDPVFPGPVKCPAEDLAKARFAAGALAPKGKMYHFSQVDEGYDQRRAIIKGIDMVSKMMTGSPFPLIGVKGMRFLAGRLCAWPRRLGAEKADLHLGNVVRMQEEIGTGGGGFRFMYAAFLQESGSQLQDAQLSTCATRLIEAGDQWRVFAAMAARICKKREKSGDSYACAAEHIRHCADIEEQVFISLREWVRQVS
ncbi:BtrH N-terminal domain-containing protein [Desulfobulbus rhabdoformis]|uniref:BtrH N-terminal domain-containing protein n=1 Tax=Desulfobulbus rhabdoformis TaxID=34032 RepID=UPI00196280E3|nr:BtrH N-terminal domain-containing protein [Desulfobulbus rhabdoformis]MBM9612934.1 BtrH N-terminal domain-containing protein [Desulfobulbus rhabdoformis]